MLKIAAGLAPARSDGLVEVVGRGFDAGVMRGQGNPGSTASVSSAGISGFWGLA